MSPWTVGWAMLTAAAVGNDSNSEQESQGGCGFVPWPRGTAFGKSTGAPEWCWL